MGRKQLISVTLAGLLAAFAANAQEHGHMQHYKPAAAPAADSRQAVDFPPEMRQHTLANMRDHLLALSEILGAMSAGEYARAALIADRRLGMDSPSAEGCKSEGAAAPLMSRPAAMDHQMAQFMPEGMRNVGLEMHKSASAFAEAARKVGRNGNPKPALRALSRVTEQCSACHSAYRLH